MAVKWQTYPRWQPPSPEILRLVEVFEASQPVIGTPANQKKSNQVLSAVSDGLRELGFAVETQPSVGSEERKKKVKVPVLFGENGKPSKTYEVDAWHDELGIVLEVEAGIAIDARKLYQDLFEAAVIPGVKTLAVAVMNGYRPARRRTPIDDFARARSILDTADASAFSYPFSSLLLIGY